MLFRSRLPDSLVDLTVPGQVTITIQDDGPYDTNPADGVIADPGAPAVITPTAPAAPTVTSVSIDDDRNVVIAWSPGFDGGTTVTEYYTACYDSSTIIANGSSINPTIALPLPNTMAGKATTCKVQAKNTAGWGPLSGASSSKIGRAHV